jgi:hypothetical protein
MDNDAPPDPRGVPFHIALDTLTDSALVNAWHEAMNAPTDDLPQTFEVPGRHPPEIITIPDQLRRAFHLRPRLEALMEDLHRKLRGGSVLCAGVAIGAGAGRPTTFRVVDWEIGILRAEDATEASIEMAGRIYGDLLFWPVPPTPPAEGWDLGYASFSLLPEQDWRAWNSDVPWKALGRVAPDLLKAIFARQDLRITGRNFDAPLGAERIVLPRDYGPERLAANTFIRAEILDSVITIHRPNGKIFRLEDVRVEPLHASEAAIQTVPPRAEPIPPPIPPRREAAVNRDERLKAIIADIRARAAASPDRPTETKQEQFTRLAQAFPGVTHAEHEGARRTAFQDYPSWSRPGVRSSRKS